MTGRHRVGLSVEGIRKLVSGEHPRRDPRPDEHPWSNPDHDIMADLAAAAAARPPADTPCTCGQVDTSVFACPQHGVWI